MFQSLLLFLGEKGNFLFQLCVVFVISALTFVLFCLCLRARVVLNVGSV